MTRALDTVRRPRDRIVIAVLIAAVLLGATAATLYGSRAAGNAKGVTALTRRQILVDTASAHRFDVVFIFGPGDCTLTRAQTDSLNQLERTVGARVTGVMVGAPSDAADARKLIDDFGLRVPVSLDPDGSWAAALRHDGYSAPLIVIARSGHVTGVFSPRHTQSLIHLATIAAY